LAQIDLGKYGSQALVQGNPRKMENGLSSVYYTNSSHVNVAASVPLGKRIKIESSFHPLLSGGTIMHVFLGEAHPDAEALWKLTKYISTKTLTGYFAYTKDMTICKACKRTNFGLLDICPNCSAEGGLLEHWSRVTGYYQEISGWNAGKREELRNRYRYSTAGKIKERIKVVA